MDNSSLTIKEAHAKLKAREISSEELVRSCLLRIEALNPTLNAVIHLEAERALAQAQELDARGVFDHPLTGIPYLAKDVFCEKGIPTTACSRILGGGRRGAALRRPGDAREDRGAPEGRPYTPPYDSTTTKRLHALGAISLGKTNTDEFTMGASTETSCYGPTRNPWDTERVAGGSSGGSAAAVSSDMCLFALGTDTGGSIRQPAGFCGCTGIRVTYGRTSRFGVMSMASSLDTIGPLAKTTEDLAIILQAMAGRDPLDATTGNLPVPDYASELTKDIRGLCIGLPREYFTSGLHQEVEGAVREASKTLESLGASLREISLPHTKYAVAVYYVLCPAEVSSNMARYDGIRYGSTVTNATTLTDYYERVRAEGFGAEVKRRIMIGTYVLSAGYVDAYYRKAQKVRTLIRRDFEEAFKDVDVILAPVSPHPAFPVGAHENDPVAMYLEDIFMCAQPLAGIPALSIPCGLTEDNVPIGLQMMGPQWGEATLLRAAHAYERARGSFPRSSSLLAMQPA